MKPHYSKSLDIMANYIQTHNDYEGARDDAISLKSKISYFQPKNADLETQTINGHCRYDSAEVTLEKPEKLEPFYTGNSIDAISKENMKIKNINLSYYGIKPRSSSRHHKGSKRLEVSKKKRKRGQIIIEEGNKMPDLEPTRPHFSNESSI